MLGDRSFTRGGAILAQRYRACGHAGASGPAAARRGLAGGLAGPRRLVRRHLRPAGGRRGAGQLTGSPPALCLGIPLRKAVSPTQQAKQSVPPPLRGRGSGGGVLGFPLQRRNRASVRRQTTPPLAPPPRGGGFGQSSPVSARRSFALYSGHDRAAPKGSARRVERFGAVQDTFGRSDDDGRSTGGQCGAGREDPQAGMDVAARRVRDDLGARRRRDGLRRALHDRLRHRRQPSRHSRRRAGDLHRHGRPGRPVRRRGPGPR